MEAATPLRQPHVRTVGDRLVVDGLVVEDETAVRLVHEREEAGQNAAETVTDAIEIGARVLDREQTGANADFVKAEFEKTARELDREFTEKARQVAEHFGTKVDEVFGPEDGVLAKSFAELFSDGSSTAVQHRVREMVAEVLARSREDLLKQFSAADGQNPLADFKKATLAVLKQADERQHQTQTALLERMGDLDKRLQALRDEKEKLEAVAAEAERGTAKGRSFEEIVAEALDGIASAQGDCAEAVGDVTGSTGKTGDVVVAVGAADGPALARLVFEAKDRKVSRPAALKELDKAMEQRDADFAVLVVPTEGEVPARMHELREYNGDKLIVAFDPDGSALPLELAYRLARARVLLSGSDAEGVDAGAVHSMVERAVASLGETRKVKSTLTGAAGEHRAGEGDDRGARDAAAAPAGRDRRPGPAGRPGGRRAGGPGPLATSVDHQSDPRTQGRSFGGPKRDPRTTERAGERR